MDITARYPPADRTPIALPKIQVEDQDTSDRFGHYSRNPSYNAVSSPLSAPMAIPNAREHVPPALPPPKFLPDIANGSSELPDLAWQYANARHAQQQPKLGASSPRINPSSSLFGGYRSPVSSFTDERPPYDRSNSSSSTIKPLPSAPKPQEPYMRFDEGFGSLTGVSFGSSRSSRTDSSLSKTRFQSSIHDHYQTSTQDYDKSLLQKLDSRRLTDNATPPRGQLTSPFSNSANEVSPTSRMKLEHRPAPHLKPLSLPTRPDSSSSSTATWSDAPMSAVSPRNITGFKQGPYDHVSPSDSIESEKSPLPYMRRSGSSSVLGNGDDAASVASFSRGSYDHTMFDNDNTFSMEETRLRHLHLDDRPPRHEAYSPNSAAGQKRRASSPIREDGPPSLHSVGSASDLYRRRESASRSSPVPPRLSNFGSISSTASGPRNSFASTLSTTASSITTVSSYGRLSPGGFSPGPTDTSIDSPFMSHMSLNPSPRSSLSRPNHQRTISESRPLLTAARKMSDAVGKPAGTNLHGMYVCECCPKKPKKFETQADLIAHEGEKQYGCQYCPNRFKNKNEAERHQNSLHLRKHSWSCAALLDCAAAFHPSAINLGEADTCGYCGEDFYRSGISSPTTRSVPRYATEHDWAGRVAHLQEVHKFKECNHNKKFFRADHFRQHLKHSHAGTSGKWTNMLENACMRDEPLPVPIRDGPSRSIGSHE